MRGRVAHVLALGLIATLAAGLYAPFLRNPLVFDDRIFFATGMLLERFSYFATHPFGIGIRLPAYFSLAFVEITWGRIDAHRIVSLALHVACAMALYKLLYDLLALARRGPESGSLCAFTPAALFAVHPVAVYGAAYLVERSIVMATLFSILSIVLFLRGLTRRSHADAVSAALLYSIAVLSKEHALLLPAAAALTVFLVQPERSFALRQVALYFAACAPAAILVALVQKGVIGTAYLAHEVDPVAVTRELQTSLGWTIAGWEWPISAVTQAGLFFRYLAAWLWPTPSALSIDLRVDFAAGWSAGWIALKLGALAAFVALGIALLRRRGRPGVAGFGLLAYAILFTLEFSVVRFQEPYVLYRSYLWAPGIAIAFAAGLSMLPARAILAVFLASCPLLAYQAHGRLVTFSSPVLLWEDALAKLPAQGVTLGWRAYYHLGREYLYSGRPEKAAQAVEHCLALYPGTFDCTYARGALYLQLEDYARALPYLQRAAELKPASGIVRHRLGLALENLDRVDDAKAQYREAARLGYAGGEHQLKRLEAPGEGLLPPKVTAPQRR